MLRIDNTQSLTLNLTTLFLNLILTNYQAIRNTCSIDYFLDLKKQTAEAYRVLKNGSCVTYVIGNSTINGIYIKNSELLKRAATLAGFKILEEAEREIPNNHRYMPMTEEVGNSLAGRMRMEHVIDFKKTA